MNVYVDAVVFLVLFIALVVTRPGVDLLGRPGRLLDAFTVLALAGSAFRWAASLAASWAAS
jgi:hypothetical protein